MLMKQVPYTQVVGAHLPVQPERHCAQGTKKKRNQGETGERLIKQDFNTDQQDAWPEQKLWSSSGDMWAVEDGRPYSPSAYEAELRQF